MYVKLWAGLSPFLSGHGSMLIKSEAQLALLIVSVQRVQWACEKTTLQISGWDEPLCAYTAFDNTWIRRVLQCELHSIWNLWQSIKIHSEKLKQRLSWLNYLNVQAIIFILPLLPKVHLAKPESPDHQRLKRELLVGSCSFFTVSQIKNHFVLRECQDCGQDIVCYIWKDRRKLIIKILVSTAVNKGHSLSLIQNVLCQMCTAHIQQMMSVLQHIVLSFIMQ